MRLMYQLVCKVFLQQRYTSEARDTQETFIYPITKSKSNVVPKVKNLSNEFIIIACLVHYCLFGTW